MKRIILIAALIICFQQLFAQYDYDAIYAIVTGNQVSIHQDNAYHNCGFAPGLEHITINDYIINWYQVDSIGILYRCMCFFDYSVTIGPLNPGNYTVFVYSVYTSTGLSDSTYEGSAFFTIEGQYRGDSIIQLTSHASECQGSILPADDQYIIENNSSGLSVICIGSGKIIKVELTNLSGQGVLRKAYNSESEILLPISALKKGLYIISLYDTNNTKVNRKVAIF